MFRCGLEEFDLPRMMAKSAWLQLLPFGSGGVLVYPSFRNVWRAGEQTASRRRERVPDVVRGR